MLAMIRIAAAMRLAACLLVAAGSVGAILILLLPKIPRRGWAALLLLAISGSFWGYTVAQGASAPTVSWAMPCFTFSAPIAIIYSFRAMKSAPDRLPSRAAIVVACLMAVLLAWMLLG